jgi:hypothetical protein
MLVVRRWLMRFKVSHIKPHQILHTGIKAGTEYSLVLISHANTLGPRLTTGRTYDHKKIINKLIINQDVLLRTPMTQVRRQIKDD